MEHGSDAALSQYLRILRRGLWLVVLTTALATLGALYASHREQKLYRSSADVLLSNQNLAANLSNIQPTSEEPTRVAATQADLAQTPAVAERALKLAHLTSRTPQQLLSHSSVSSASNADILTFAVTDPNPLVAQRLTQAYATAYTRYRRQLDTGSIAQALKKVETRLRELKAAGAQGSAGYADLVDKEQRQQHGRAARLKRTARPLRRPCRQDPAEDDPERRARRGTRTAARRRTSLPSRRAQHTCPNSQRSARTSRLAAASSHPRASAPSAQQEPARELSEPTSPIAETYRILGTNLDFVNLERNARTIMFTSAQRAESKSTTVANLAI